MKIHLCIESLTGGGEYVLENRAKDGLKDITHQLYSNNTESIISLLRDLSCLSNDTYVIFVKYGDKISIPNNLGEVDSNIGLYLFLDQKREKFPRVNSSPFSMSNFYQGRYNNCDFMLRAELFKAIVPDFSFGPAWYMNIIMSLLYVTNISARVFPQSIILDDSQSLKEPVGDNDIRLKIIPAKYGYNLSDMMVMDEARAKQVRRKIILKRLKRLSMSKIQLFIKFATKPNKYGLYFKSSLFRSKYEGSWNNVPIIINNFNRLEYLVTLIQSLEKRGVTNIHILDNNSTYPPLLEYYKTTPYKVHYLGENLGYRALWKSSVYDIFKNDYYVYTDPDLSINDCCPDDFMDHFIKLHKKYPLIWKVGFSLDINDLPDCFSKKHEVQKWEGQFNDIEIEKEIFYAPIDTTFALYKPFGISDNIYSLRVGGNYSMKHLPWYIDSEKLSEEETYYVNSCVHKTHWSVFK